MTPTISAREEGAPASLAAGSVVRRRFHPSNQLCTPFATCGSNWLALTDVRRQQARAAATRGSSRAIAAGLSEGLGWAL